MTATKNVDSKNRTYAYAIYYDCLSAGTVYNNVYACHFHTLLEAENEINKRLTYSVPSYNYLAFRVEVVDWQDWKTLDVILYWDKDKGYTYV